MTTASDIQSGIGGARAVLDIAKGIRSLESEASINEAVIDIQRHAIEAQQALFAAQEAIGEKTRRIDQLEQENARLKSWSEDRATYELADTGQGALAYRSISPDQKGVAPWLCPNCFEEGRKSILQPERYSVGRTETLLCHRCHLELLVEGQRREGQPRPTGKRY